MKADIDAAFRRIPVKDDHRWATSVAWLFRNEPWMATHIGMPFGAAASGIAWHKIGDLLCEIGRKLLGIPLFRYVDDYFAVDRYAAPCVVPCDGVLSFTWAGRSQSNMRWMRSYAWSERFLDKTP